MKDTNNKIIYRSRNLLYKAKISSNEIYKYMLGFFNCGSLQKVNNNAVEFELCKLKCGRKLGVFYHSSIDRSNWGHMQHSIDPRIRT